MFCSPAEERTGRAFLEIQQRHHCHLSAFLAEFFEKLVHGEMCMNCTDVLLSFCPDMHCNNIGKIFYGMLKRRLPILYFSVVTSINGYDGGTFLSIIMQMF